MKQILQIAITVIIFMLAVGAIIENCAKGI